MRGIPTNCLSYNPHCTHLHQLCHHHHIIMGVPVMYLHRRWAGIGNRMHLYSNQADMTHSMCYSVTIYSPCCQLLWLRLAVTLILHQMQPHIKCMAGLRGIPTSCPLYNQHCSHPHLLCCYHRTANQLSCCHLRTGTRTMCCWHSSSNPHHRISIPLQN